MFFLPVIMVFWFYFFGHTEIFADEKLTKNTIRTSTKVTEMQSIVSKPTN